MQVKSIDYGSPVVEKKRREGPAPGREEVIRRVDALEKPTSARKENGPPAERMELRKKKSEVERPNRNLPGLKGPLRKGIERDMSDTSKGPQPPGTGKIPRRDQPTKEKGSERA